MLTNKVRAGAFLAMAFMTGCIGRDALRPYREPPPTDIKPTRIDYVDGDAFDALFETAPYSAQKKFDSLFATQRLRVAVEEALRAADGRPVVVDLTAVTFLGSHGLAALAEAASKAEQRREPLRVVVDETLAVIRPLQITGLDEVLALYYSVGDALPQ